MNETTLNYIKTLRKFCAVFGISGNESRTGISKVVLEELKNINSRAFEDKFGNVIAVFGNGSKKILLDAHIDEVGFVVANKEKDKFSLFPIGDIDPKKVDRLSVCVLFKNISGKIIAQNNNFLFIPDQVGDLKNISIGDFVSFERNFEINGNIVNAAALDNRVGCAAIIELMKVVNIPKDLSIITVFSTEEERDSSNIGAIASEYNPDFGIVIDAAYAKPIEIDTEETSIPELEKGCAIQYLGKDFTVNFSIIEKLEKLAKINNIKRQPEIPFPTIGRTNFPKLEKVGVKAGVINIPVRYQHTDCSQFCVNDALEAVRLLRAVIANFEIFLD